LSAERSKRIDTKRKLMPELYSLQSCFEADRGALLRQLEDVGNAVEESATEMAMIAAEGVFDRRVSKILASEVRAMRRTVQGLKDLRVDVARARLPQNGK
jgi:hypothetical protein